MLKPTLLCYVRVCNASSTRAGVKGSCASSVTTSTPVARAVSTDPSLEPESTYTAREAQPCPRRHEPSLPELGPDREAIPKLERSRARSDLVERRLLGEREVVEMAEDPAPRGHEHEAMVELRREALTRKLRQPVRVERRPEPSAVAGGGPREENG